MSATNVGDSSPDGEGIQMVNPRRVSAMEQGTFSRKNGTRDC